MCVCRCARTVGKGLAAAHHALVQQLGHEDRPHRGVSWPPATAGAAAAAATQARVGKGAAKAAREEAVGDGLAQKSPVQGRTVVLGVGVEHLSPAGDQEGKK